MTTSRPNVLKLDLRALGLPVRPGGMVHVRLIMGEEKVAGASSSGAGMNSNTNPEQDAPATINEEGII
jgi:hypothetical protein